MTRQAVDITSALASAPFDMSFYFELSRREWRELENASIS